MNTDHDETEAEVRAEVEELRVEVSCLRSENRRLRAALARVEDR